MKRILFSSLILILVLSMIGMLTACGAPKDDPSKETADDTTGTSSVTVTTNDDATTDDVTNDESVTTEAVTESVITDPDRYFYKYVVIVGVDGAGSFFKDANTPNFDTIFANGALTYEARTESPSISGPCWGSMFHGVAPEVHMLTNDSIEDNVYPMTSDYPSIFRVIREQMPEASLASFCNWDEINVGIIEDEIGVYKASESSDKKVVDAAVEYINTAADRGEDVPTFMYLQLDQVDATGHSSGYGTTNYLRVIEKMADTYIQTLYQAYADLGILEDTLFIVTTDHGGYEDDHGGNTDAEMLITFAAAGKTVVNGTVGEMLIRDVASIVVYALGLEQPSTWTSRVPSGLFEGVEAGERPES